MKKETLIITGKEKKKKEFLVACENLANSKKYSKKIKIKDFELSGEKKDLKDFKNAMSAIIKLKKVKLEKKSND